ncbi:MAG: hypothetical protein FWG42_08195 [Clostridiales bacterium]|nr:hypothetical protein [Clostridiales bacterium]
MPLFLLGLLVGASVAIYMYLLNNQDRFVKKNAPPNDPFNVIYLPADLEAYKKAHRGE